MATRQTPRELSKNERKIYCRFCLHRKRKGKSRYCATCEALGPEGRQRQSQQANALLRKITGRCLRCPNKAPWGQGVCFDCTEKMAQGKQAALAAGKCVQCWQENSLSDKRYCAACNQRLLEKQKSLYQARKEAGLCVKCGKAPHYNARLICAYCWGKRYGH